MSLLFISDQSVSLRPHIGQVWNCGVSALSLASEAQQSAGDWTAVPWTESLKKLPGRQELQEKSRSTAVEPPGGLRRV